MHKVIMMQASDAAKVTRLHIALSNSDRVYYSPFLGNSFKLFRTFFIIGVATSIFNITGTIFAPFPFLAVLTYSPNKSECSGFAYIRRQKKEPLQKVELGIVVAENFRGKSMAASLVIEIIKLAKKAKIYEMYVWVNEDNYIAINLYQKLGFASSDVTEDRGIYEKCVYRQMSLFLT